MKWLKLKSADIFINNAENCKGCKRWIPYVLAPDESVRVHLPSGEVVEFFGRAR